MRRLKLFTLCIIIIHQYCMNGSLYAEHDNSLRIDQNFYGTIGEQFQLVSYFFEQKDRDMSEYDYFEFGIGLQYQTPLTWLSILPYYQQSYTRGNDDRWLMEKKPSININTSFIISHLKIYDQIRYEYRITPEWEDYRIKNYLEFSLHDIFLQPGLGWELYYEDHDKDIMLNRIKFGISRNVYTSITLGTYYRIDFAKINDRWEFTRQLIGFQVTLKY